MGTLVFHILLVSSFLLSEVRLKGEITEEPVIIDFADTPEKADEIPEEEPQPEKEQKDENTPSDDHSPATESKSNRGVNDAPSKDPFFNEEYQKEIAQAQKLVSDVNKQLSKKMPDFKEFEMPEETTEGVDPDSIKNTIYSGESNIHYYLQNRYHVRLPIPVYLAQGGGKVTVDIWVSPAGRVIRAELRSTTQSGDPMLPEYARQAAERTVFNADKSAPSPQKGTITYTFVPQ
ncbi:MAG: energy transducer TonB [Prolixibacteraceae bacterium]